MLGGVLCIFAAALDIGLACRATVSGMLRLLQPCSPRSQGRRAKGGAGACTLAARQAEVHILAWPAADGSPAGARAGWGRPEGSVLVVSLLPGLLATLAVMHASTQQCMMGNPVDDAIRPALSCACGTDCQSAPLLRVVLPLAATGHMDCCHPSAGLITLTLWQRTSRWTLQSPCCRQTPCCMSPGRSCKIRSVPLCLLGRCLLHSLLHILLHPGLTSCRALCGEADMCSEVSGFAPLAAM